MMGVVTVGVARNAVFGTALFQNWELVQYCQGGHEHASWAPYLDRGRWVLPSASEAECPVALCKLAAKLILSHWPLHFQQEHHKVQLDSTLRKNTRTAGQVQPRGLQNPVVPEFAEIIVMNTMQKPRCAVGEKGGANDPMAQHNCKLVRLSEVGSYGTNQDMKYQSAWGRWASPSEFVKSASVAKHPMLENHGIDDVLAAVIAEILSLGAVAVSRKRFQEILKWRARATELQPAEDAIHAEWHESQRNVLSGKRFLLMKEMLEQINYQDSGLIEELLEGAKLTGANKPSNVFPKICPWKIPTSDSQLRAKSKWVRKALRAQCKPAAEASFDVAVWAATEAVLQKKWLSGPFDSEEAVSTAIGTEDWIPSPRFGLKQGSKIRAIDNYSAGGVNGAFVSDEKVDLQGIDHVAALAKALATAVADDRTYCLTSNSGKELRCHSLLVEFEPSQRGSGAHTRLRSCVQADCVVPWSAVDQHSHSLEPGPEEAPVLPSARASVRSSSIGVAV